jgi:hypothetical protein
MSYYCDFLSLKDEYGPEHRSVYAAFAETEYDSVETGVNETLEHWWENTSNPQLYWLRNRETNEIAAVMHSRAGEETPEGGHSGLVSVTYNEPSGGYDHRVYRVTYHVNAEGLYDRTEVTEVEGY